MRDPDFTWEGIPVYIDPLVPPNMIILWPPDDPEAVYASSQEYFDEQCKKAGVIKI